MKELADEALRALKAMARYAEQPPTPPAVVVEKTQAWPGFLAGAGAMVLAFAAVRIVVALLV
jgi:ubiquinone biosynthesis protein